MKRIFEEIDGLNGVGKGEQIRFDIENAMCSSDVVIREIDYCLPSLDEHMRTMRAVLVRCIVEIPNYRSSY